MTELSLAYIKTRVSDYHKRNPRDFFWLGEKVDRASIWDEAGYLPLFVLSAMTLNLGSLPRMVYDQDAAFMFRLSDSQPISQEQEALFFRNLEILLKCSSDELSYFFRD